MLKPSPDVQQNFSRWSPAVRVEKGDHGPGEFVVGGDEKSSPGEGAPANSVDDSPHKTAKELHVSKGVDVSENDEKGVELEALHLKYPCGAPLLKFPSNTVPSGFRLATAPSNG